MKTIVNLILKMLNVFLGLFFCQILSWYDYLDAHFPAYILKLIYLRLHLRFTIHCNLQKQYVHVNNIVCRWIDALILNTCVRCNWKVNVFHLDAILTDICFKIVFEEYWCFHCEVNSRKEASQEICVTARYEIILKFYDCFGMTYKITLQWTD